MQHICKHIEKHSWVSLRDQVKSLAPGFSDIIDDIAPDKSHSLYFIRYPYGALVLDKGVFQVPNNDCRLVPLSHSSISVQIKNDLGYTDTVPLGLVINNGFESFTQTQTRILPSSYMGKGKFISLWRVFEEAHSYYTGPFWSYSAGARSICMLPKITDSASFKNLKSKYGLKFSVPRNLSEHWALFTELANHSLFPQPWSSDVIFFSKNWFAHKKDKRWCEFYRFLVNQVWQMSSHRRNQFIVNSAFSIVLDNRNLKPNPYLADTVKHLVSIGTGDFPSFAAAIDNSAAPVSGLQKVYLEDYGLKKYAPVIMHSYGFSSKAVRPAYYSFQLPTTTVFSPKSRKLSSAMAELHELKHIVEVFMSEILKGNLGVEKTPLYDLAKNIRFDYYHSDKDKFDVVSSVSHLNALDPSFIKTIDNQQQYHFPEFAPFFRGCVSISNATEQSAVSHADSA